MSNAVISFPILGEGFSVSLSPTFSILGFTIHWYGVIIAVGFALAVLYGMVRAKKFGLTQDNIIDLLIFAVPLAIIGARAYYVLFSWKDYKDAPLNIFKIWQGGLAIYGGVIGAVLGAFIFSKVKKIRFSVVADIGALGLLIGQAVGRWGNFINREAYGVKTAVAWKMGLTNEFGTFYYHPCFLYESLWNIIGFIILHFYSKKRKFDGEIFLLYIAWYGLGRVFIEGLRTDSLYIPGTNLRVSQLVALLSVIFGLGYAIYIRVAKNPEPEDLWLNRDIKNFVSEQSKAAEALPFSALNLSADGEDFSETLRLLRHGTDPDAEDGELTVKSSETENPDSDAPVEDDKIDSEKDNAQREDL
jgi:phosphatidylglycerol:prolipoprotein diacylglycerol transferase